MSDVMIINIEQDLNEAIDAMTNHLQHEWNVLELESDSQAVSHMRADSWISGWAVFATWI